MDQILTLSQGAKLLKVTDKTVYSLTPDGTHPGFEARAQLRFRRVDSDGWIEELETKQSSGGAAASEKEGTCTMARLSKLSCLPFRARDLRGNMDAAELS